MKNAIKSAIAVLAITITASAFARAEIVIPTKQVAKFRALAIEATMKAGGNVTIDTPSTLKMTGGMSAASSFGWTLLMGNAYSSQPTQSFVFTFATTGATTHVFADTIVELQTAFGQNRRMDLSNRKKEAAMLDTALKTLAARSK
jgi:hypothetical protein